MRWLQFLQRPVTFNQTLENACDRKLRETHKNEKIVGQALEKGACVTVTVVKFLQGKILLSNELTVKNILGYKLLSIG